MNQRVKILACLFVAGLLSTSLSTSAFADTTGELGRITKLEDRVRDLETRMAKVEGDVHSHMGMGMKMDHGNMPSHNADAKMGTAPQGNMPSDSGNAMKHDGMEMPPMGQNQQPMNNGQQGGGMQQGGMGDM